MGDTAISWCSKTWNLTAGCTKVSEGCRNCYAARLVATRLRHLPHNEYLAEKTASGYDWTGPVNLRPEKLEEPLRWRKPEIVFVDSQSDLFHEKVPFQFIDRVFDVMATCRRHTFLVLTKRPERMQEFVTDWNDRYLPGRAVAMKLPNVHLGVSVENQQAADERIPLLLQTPAAVRWISAEPLIGPIHLGPENCHVPDASMVDRTIDWIVVGCESGPGARPCDPDWIRHLRDQASAGGSKFYLKQMMVGGKLVHLPELDGRQHTEVPS